MKQLVRMWTKQSYVETEQILAIIKWLSVQSQ
jgi:hypothetical protein